MLGLKPGPCAHEGCTTKLYERILKTKVKWVSFWHCHGMPLNKHAACNRMRGEVGRRWRAKGCVRVGTWEREADRQTEHGRDRKKRGKRNKRGKKSKRLESGLCLVTALKGCSCRTADGGKSPGDRWWCADGVTALQAEAGCCWGGD